MRFKRSRKYGSSTSSDDSDLDEDYYASYQDKVKGQREKAKRQKAKMEAKLTKKKQRKIKRVKIPPFQPVRVVDESGVPFVKNFCVGLVLLDDDFVLGALLGNLRWDQVFQHDEQQTRKHRKRIACQSQFDPGYLFERGHEAPIAKKPANRVEPIDLKPNLSFPVTSRQQRDLSASLCPALDETSSFDSRLTGRSLPSSTTVSLDSRSTDHDLRQDSGLKNLNRILQQLKSLEAGLETVDNGVEPMRCLDCSYTTTSIQNLLQHSSYHRNQCSDCNQAKFKSLYSYYRHIGMHLKQSQTVCSLKLGYRCGRCNVEFRQEDRLLDHFNRYHTVFDQQVLYGEQIIRFRCRICNQVDLTYKALQDHYRRCHTQLKCALCTRWLPSIEQLEQHALLEHRFSAHNYECCFCGQMFTFRVAFEEHFKYRHGIVIGEDKRGSCFLCSEPLDHDKDHVLAHLAGHCDLHLYSCETCDLKLVFIGNFRFFVFKTFSSTSDQASKTFFPLTERIPNRR